MNDIMIYAVLSCAIGFAAVAIYLLWKVKQDLLAALLSKESVASETGAISTLQREFQELKSEWGNIRDDMFRYQAKIARSWGHIKAATDHLQTGDNQKELPDELPLSAAEDADSLVDGGGGSAENRSAQKREIMRKVRARNASPSV